MTRFHNPDFTMLEFYWAFPLTSVRSTCFLYMKFTIF